MLKTNSTKPTASFRQLCAIAKRELLSDPMVDNVEWKERIKDRTVRDGYGTPWSEQCYRAMDAVAHAHPTLRQNSRPWRPAPAAREIPAEDDTTYWTRKPRRQQPLAPSEGFTLIGQEVAKFQRLLETIRASPPLSALRRSRRGSAQR